MTMIVIINWLSVCVSMALHNLKWQRIKKKIRNARAPLFFRFHFCLKYFYYYFAVLSSCAIVTDDDNVVTVWICASHHIRQ